MNCLAERSRTGTTAFLSFQPLNSQDLPRQNFFLQYQYNIKKASGENKGKYLLGDDWLIQCQILRTVTIRIVWRTVRRIINEIFEVKGLFTLWI